MCNNLYGSLSGSGLLVSLGSKDPYLDTVVAVVVAATRPIVLAPRGHMTFDCYWSIFSVTIC